MKYYQVKYSGSSTKSLQNSYFYIKYRLSNPIASTNFYLRYIKKIQLLKSFPLSFQKIENTNYRRLIFDNWIILYEVQEDIVIIQFIFHSKQNYLYQLKYF